MLPRSLNRGDLEWIDIRLALAVHEINQDFRNRSMSVEVKGLADIVRQAKDAIRVASDAAAGMRASASDLSSTVSQVLDMKNQLDSANADLKAAVGTMSNGGPPLGEPSGSAPSSSASALPMPALNSAAASVDNYLAADSGSSRPGQGLPNGTKS